MKRIARWTKPQKSAAGSVLFLAIVLIVAGLSGDPEPETTGAEAPQVTETKPDLKRSKEDIEREFAEGVIHAEIRGSLGSADGKVKCQGNTCDVSYRVEKLFGQDLDTGLVEIQRNVWRQIFDLTEVREGTITLIGDAKTIGGLDQRRPFLRVTCTREAAEQINWSEIDKAGMVELCDWDELVTIAGEPA